ncbi:hypothetical protein BAOM_2385 [Peribacillus asahii]|uniref:Uncharacterized protein n=1 Tax=Peribacillus asahii TaxID=228899 RepID=A0A3T0KRY8_9BACI|nr:hypothetical protein BAOM_2385 [Peribacillus asahii]
MFFEIIFAPESVSGTQETLFSFSSNQFKSLKICVNRHLTSVQKRAFS